MKQVLLILLMLALLPAGSPVSAAPIPTDVFSNLWSYYDLPVYQGANQRSWTWGLLVTGHSVQIRERFEDAPTGTRAVMYFDKGRMELTDPAGDPASPWYVTSGLLPVELLTGRMQLGYNSFEQRQPAAVSAIGDPESFPTYADLLPLYQSPGRASSADAGKPASCLINSDGSLGTTSDYAEDRKTWLVQAENGHHTAQAFLNFQTQVGPVYEGSSDYTWKQVYDPPIFVFGLPLSEPCWVETTIGGREQMVLFQIFERRLLTYNPANEASFQVEMGNIGQHYYYWRYGQYNFAPPAFSWDVRSYKVPSDPLAVYTLDVMSWEMTGPGVQEVEINYTLYFSHDGGATREKRYEGQIGPCRKASVTLVAPYYQEASAERIGIATLCSYNPSQARGFGITLYQSADGGRSFWVEREY